MLKDSINEVAELKKAVALWKDKAIQAEKNLVEELLKHPMPTPEQLEKAKKMPILAQNCLPADWEERIRDFARGQARSLSSLTIYEGIQAIKNMLQSVTVEKE